MIYKDQNVEVNALCHGNYGKSNWKKNESLVTNIKKRKKMTTGCSGTLSLARTHIQTASKRLMYTDLCVHQGAAITDRCEVHYRYNRSHDPSLPTQTSFLRRDSSREYLKIQTKKERDENINTSAYSVI